jgi:peptidoglycan/xylan/chitin deacetylase (PgdA/CDA1 family)
MLTRQQVRGLRDLGFEVGGHTVNHPILARIDAARARKELAENKEDLEALLGERLRSFAYPNGTPERDFGVEHARMVRSLGYETAVTTRPGASGPQTNPFLLPRFTPWDRAPLKFCLRMVLNMRRVVVADSHTDP